MGSFLYNKTFRGSLDGNGYALSGFNCYNYECSLFDVVKDAYIHDLVINQFTINGLEEGYSATLVGISNDSVFSDIIILNTSFGLFEEEGYFIGVVCGVWKRVQYVHELQLLLNLSGITANIKP